MSTRYGTGEVVRICPRTRLIDGRVSGRVRPAAVAVPHCLAEHVTSCIQNNQQHTVSPKLNLSRLVVCLFVVQHDVQQI